MTKISSLFVFVILCGVACDLRIEIYRRCTWTELRAFLWQQVLSFWTIFSFFSNVPSTPIERLASLQWPSFNAPVERLATRWMSEPAPPTILDIHQDFARASSATPFYCISPWRGQQRFEGIRLFHFSLSFAISAAFYYLGLGHRRRASLVLAWRRILLM